MTRATSTWPRTRRTHVVSPLLLLTQSHKSVQNRIRNKYLFVATDFHIQRKPPNFTLARDVTYSPESVELGLGTSNQLFRPTKAELLRTTNIKRCR